MTKPWSKMTNDELVMHLALWLEMDGRVESPKQKEFFEELIFRLQLTSRYEVKGDNNE